MKPLGCVRAVAVAAVLGSGILAAGPAGARTVSGAGAQWESVTVEAGSLRGDRQGGEEHNLTLAVSGAILALGGLWMMLMTRRMAPRGAMGGVRG